MPQVSLFAPYVKADLGEQKVLDQEKLSPFWCAIAVQVVVPKAHVKRKLKSESQVLAGREQERTCGRHWSVPGQ